MLLSVTESAFFFSTSTTAEKKNVLNVRVVPNIKGAKTSIFENTALLMMFKYATIAGNFALFTLSTMHF